VSARRSAPPPSAGEILLLSNSTDAAASASLGDALTSGDPAIRIAAGRVVASVPHGELRPALLGALAREHEPAAGAEFIRDILHLSARADLAFVEPQAKRLGGPALLALAEWLARIDPVRFAERLPDFAADDQDRRAVSDMVTIAARQHRESAEVVLRGWMALAPDGGWDVVLRRTYGVVDVPESAAAILVEAIKAPQASVREETIWYVARAVAGGLNVPGSVVVWAGVARPDASSWESFGRELVARRGKAPDGPDRHELIAAEGPRHLADIHALGSAPQLTAAERAAAAAIGIRPKNPFADLERSVSAARTIPALVPGAIADTLKAANCVPRASSTASGTMLYGADGWPQRVTVDPTGLSRECQAAWTALVRTAVADSGEHVGEVPQVLFLPWGGDFVACADAAAANRPAERPPHPISASRIAQPKKIKDVKPEYPADAQRHGIQGVVIIEGTISPTGCVAQARLLRSLPPLDGPAMAAVTAWKFTPTLVNGVAVPVTMTVTVNFAMQ
jgi:TonB family protein